MPRTIKADGRTIVVPDDATDEEINQIVGPAPGVAGAGSYGVPQLSAHPAVSMKPAIPGYDANPGAGTNFAKGVLKSIPGTVAGLSKLVYPEGAEAPNSSVHQIEAMATPHGTAQAIGKGVGDAAQFLIPGAGEEKVALGLASKAPALGRAALPLSRAALAAVDSGLINKVQGGDFTTGAAGGAIGSGIATGVSAIAPHVAESALNIRRLDRAYKDKNAIGRAILDETKGFTPESVSDSAQGVLNKLNPEVESLADASTNKVSLKPARATVSNAVDKAVSQGERTTYSQLQPLGEHLDRTMFNLPIPEDVTAREALNLKRGIGNEFVNRWNPETMEGVKGTAAKAYHDIGQGFLQAVPEARQPLNRISNLIPVAKRAESLELNAPTTSKILHRLSAHTGALTGGVIGAQQGYQHGGASGAVLGGLGGLIIPEMIASPTGEMVIARTMNSPVSRNLARGVVGSGLQLNRPEK